MLFIKIICLKYHLLFISLKKIKNVSPTASGNTIVTNPIKIYNPIKATFLLFTIIEETL